MTLFATAALHKLLLRRFAPHLGGRPWRAATVPALVASELRHTPPMHFRSEGFAEDLLDSYPTKGFDRFECTARV